MFMYTKPPRLTQARIGIAHKLVLLPWEAPAAGSARRGLSDPWVKAQKPTQGQGASGGLSEVGRCNDRRQMQFRQWLLGGHTEEQLWQAITAQLPLHARSELQVDASRGRPEAVERGQAAGYRRCRGCFMGVLF